MTTKAYFAMKHDTPPSEQLVRRILAEAGSPTVPTLEGGRPVTAEDNERYFQLMLSDKFEGSLPGFTFHVQRLGGKSLEIPLNFALLHTGSVIFDTGRVLRIKPFQREPWKWCIVSQGNNALDPETDGDASWFLDRVRPLIPILRPSFAFADTRDRVHERIGEDPQRVAWPLMIFGPSEVERIGRQKLLDAPAWKVEELDYGGIWIQVDENPFIAAEDNIAKLAKHLGLIAQNGRQNSADRLKRS